MFQNVLGVQRSYIFNKNQANEILIKELENFIKTLDKRFAILIEYPVMESEVFKPIMEFLNQSLNLSVF